MDHRPISSRKQVRNKKLDRFLLSNNFINSVPNLIGRVLPNLWSDHCLIVIFVDYLNYGPSPFKLFAFWFLLDGFNLVVRNVWLDPHLEPDCYGKNPFIIFKNKLKFVKSKLKSWYVSQSNSFCVEKKNLLDSIDSVDEELVNRGDIINLSSCRLNALKDLMVIDKREGMNMAQKFKKIWISQGDENSSLFHSYINRKRKKMAVSGVLSNVLWISSPDSVKSSFLDFFKTKFKHSSNVKIKNQSVHLKKLPVTSAIDLEKPFSEL
ncbi:uncharacterized protein [Rutidosis leptorrhynchoides]|uniref:uncharacterized protein n=1 Tax=Rutidosis leptorrhynchoides TaxID=125765 RepID=UPI003A99CEAB